MTKWTQQSTAVVIKWPEGPAKL